MGDVVVFDHDSSSGRLTRSATAGLTAKAPDPRHGVVAGGDTDAVFVLSDTAVLPSKVGKGLAVGAAIQAGACWGDVLYAACGGGDVLVYDLAKDAEVSKPPALVVNAPDGCGVGVHPSGKALYVVDHHGSRLRVFDISGDQARSPRAQGMVEMAGLHGTCVAVSQKYVFVAVDEKGIAVFDAGDPLSLKSVGRVGEGDVVSRLAVSPDGGRLYVVNGSETRLLMYTISNGEAGKPPVLSAPVLIDCQASGHALVLAGVGVLDQDWVMVTDKQLNLHLLRTTGNATPVWYSTTPITGIPGTDPGIGSTPIPHITGATKSVFVAAPKATTPAVIRLDLAATTGHQDLIEFGAPIPVGLMPTAVVASPATGNIYTTNTGDNSVSVLVPTPVDIKITGHPDPIKGIDWTTPAATLNSSGKGSLGPAGAGSYLYFIEGDNGRDLRIIDTSGLAAKPAKLTEARTITAMFTEQAYALASDNKRLAVLQKTRIQLFDLTGPHALTPQPQTTIEEGHVQGGNGSGIALSPRFLCYSDNTTKAGGGEKFIDVLGFNATGTPKIWAYAFVTEPQQLALAGDLLYAVGASARIDIYDLSTLQDPGTGTATHISPTHTINTHDQHTYTSLSTHAGYLYTTGPHPRNGIDINDITGTNRTQPH
ncbi:hypothetical protein [Nocardia brasiliensis]|uniref:hypothetical protein n=1 Tax=Nocardia brasiliensis TaxID=37326 RepID=UPI002454F580|nr:hypothetical protein [Nocardia brasiliensis]